MRACHRVCMSLEMGFVIIHLVLHTTCCAGLQYKRSTVGPSEVRALPSGVAEERSVH